MNILIILQVLNNKTCGFHILHSEPIEDKFYKILSYMVLKF